MIDNFPAVIISIIVGTLSAVVNFLFFINHKAPKRWLRLVSSIVVGYFAVIYFLAAVQGNNFLPTKYLRPYVFILLGLPMADAIADWRARKKRISNA